MTDYTTVAFDKYGRYYDLRFEHPSWEEKKKGVMVCTVRNAFTCTIEEANRLTGRKVPGADSASSPRGGVHGPGYADSPEPPKDRT